MNYEFKNPFADSGRIVTNDTFIGRKEIKTKIEGLIFDTTGIPNLAIVGVNRIGTSSLAYNAILEQRDELISQKIAPIWIDSSSYEHTLGFFNSLVTRCVNEIKNLDLPLIEIQDSAKNALDALRSGFRWNPWDEIKDFFEKVKAAGVGTLFILDRFDKTRYLFEGNTAFDFLRHLASHPDYNVSLVLTSRMSVSEIQRQAGSSSKFHGIFSKSLNYLGMFSEEDLNTYFSKFSSIDIDTNAIRERVLFYCGGHPDLLNLLGTQIFEKFRKNRKIDVNENSVDEAVNSILDSFHAYYKDLIALLEEMEILNELLHVLFDSVKVGQTVVNDFLNYGLIKEIKLGTYTAYSKHFHDYLCEQHTASSFTIGTNNLTQPVEIQFIQGQEVPLEETRLCEFKDISRSKKPESSIANTADEYAVAFLNGEGGRIFWGINDSGNTVGVELDRQQRDEVREQVSNKLSRIRPPVNVADYKFEFHEVYNADGAAITDLLVVELVVSPPQRPNVFYTESHDLFVKTDGGKTKLTGQAVTEFILRVSG